MPKKVVYFLDASGSLFNTVKALMPNLLNEAAMVAAWANFLNDSSLTLLSFAFSLEKKLRGFVLIAYYPLINSADHSIKYNLKPTPHKTSCQVFALVHMISYS